MDDDLGVALFQETSNSPTFIGFGQVFWELLQETPIIEGKEKHGLRVSIFPSTNPMTLTYN